MSDGGKASVQKKNYLLYVHVIYSPIADTIMYAMNEQSLSSLRYMIRTRLSNRENFTTCDEYVLGQ